LSEKEFRLDLAIDLEDRFEWDVYHHDKYKEYSGLERKIKKFHMSNAKGYPDLYCYTKLEEFPIIAIETKICDGLNTFTKAINQVEKYVNDEDAKYIALDQEVPRPNIILVASPDSYYNDILYLWSGPETFSGRWVDIKTPERLKKVKKRNKKKNGSEVYSVLIKGRRSGIVAVEFMQGESMSFAFDYLVDRMLWQRGCAILKHDLFMYNGTNYSLGKERPKQRSLF